MASKSNSSAKSPEILPESEFNKKWEPESQYSFLRKSNDPRFGEISVFKCKTNNDLIFTKEKLVTSKQQASNDIRDIMSRATLNNDYLHRLLGYSTVVQKELCSTNYLTRAFYEFPKSDLQKEINDRKPVSIDFSHEELYSVAQQTILGLSNLHKLELCHCDIRPLNIGYNKTTRNVQILDRLNDPSPLEKVQSNNIINKKDLFMSPELYKKLQGKDKSVKYNQFKNDLYAVGMSILTAGLLESVQNVYKTNGEFDQQRLNSYLDRFDAKYAGLNPGLSSLIHALLRADENDRPTINELIDDQKSVVADTSDNHFDTTQSTQNQYVTYTQPPVAQTYTYDHPVEYARSATPTSYVANANQQNEGRLVTVHRLDGTVYSYYTKTDIDLNDTINTYEQNDPRNLAKNNEQSNATNSNSANLNQRPEAVTHSAVNYLSDRVDSVPSNYTYVPQGNYYIVNDNAPVYETSYHRQPYMMPTESNVYTYGQPSRVVNGSQRVNAGYSYAGETPVSSSYQSSNPVEVRQGTPMPTANPTTSINKKYIIKDGNVVEVDEE